jgi:4'-phosphopantetheinyl transferase
VIAQSSTCTQASAVTVLSVWLDQPDATFERCLRLLSADEADRASRFVFERDRRHFVVCRGSLREALGALLDRDPASVVFAYGPQGKPVLRDGELEFNVSHSAGLALFAFSGNRPVGVDVESLDREVDAEALATRFFSPQEAADLLSVPIEQRREAFFNCWTRKESYIKALGKGLQCPLDSFSVTLGPGQKAAIRRIDGDDPARWEIVAFTPAHGYVAAVAMCRTAGSRGQD